MHQGSTSILLVPPSQRHIQTVRATYGQHDRAGAPILRSRPNSTWVLLPLMPRVGSYRGSASGPRGRAHKGSTLRKISLPPAAHYCRRFWGSSVSCSDIRAIRVGDKGSSVERAGQGSIAFWEEGARLSCPVDLALNRQLKRGSGSLLPPRSFSKSQVERHPRYLVGVSQAARPSLGSSLRTRTSLKGLL